MFQWIFALMGFSEKVMRIAESLDLLLLALIACGGVCLVLLYIIPTLSRCIQNKRSKNKDILK